ncbi:MAG: mechanosensitive ion channel [Saprospiraceae bacterium]|nr:mechanosensitive ion channel [Saprospiraceae bacterium]
MKRILLVLIAGLIWLNMSAQNDSINVNDNPYAVIYNHLKYLQPDSYEPVTASKSLPDNTLSPEKTAIKLKQVLDGKGLFVDLNRLPQNPDYYDTLHNGSFYFLDHKEPLIYIEKTGDSWYYSRTTMSELPRMHKELYPFGTQYITYFQAPVWQVKLLGIKIWKWLGIVVLFIASWLFYRIFQFISRTFIQRFLKKRLPITEDTDKTILKVARLVGLILAVRFILYFIPMFQFTPKLTSIAIKGFNVLSIFFIILLLREILHLFFKRFEIVTEKTENTLDDQLLPVLEKLGIIILWCFGVVYILDYLDVNITALLAGISIGGLALALAAQDTVKNFFGSIMIFLDKPFQIGDWISFKDVSGAVEEVGVRSTRIRTFANSITYVPNAILADSIIDNLGLRVFRRFKMELGLTYDTTADTIDVFAEGIREIIKLHPSTKKDDFEVHLNNFGDSSINILVILFFNVDSWSNELAARHSLLNSILKLAEQTGVRFAFPTQTLHIEELPLLGNSSTPQSQEAGQLSKKTEQAIADIKSYFDEQKTKE